MPKIEGKEMETVTGILNRATELLCDAKGSEPINIEWLKEREKIENIFDINNALVQVQNIELYLNLNF